MSKFGDLVSGKKAEAPAPAPAPAPVKVTDDKKNEKSFNAPKLNLN